MGIFFVFMLPLVAGFGLIFLIARFSPNVPRVESLKAGQKLDDRPEITADEFIDVVRDLLEALGLETVFSSAGTGGVFDVTARDPKPLSGGRILLHATPVLTGQVDAVDVLSFAEGVRGHGRLEGHLHRPLRLHRRGPRRHPLEPRPGGLDRRRPPPRAGAGAPPGRAELLEGYRGFDLVSRRHARAGREVAQS